MKRQDDVTRQAPRREARTRPPKRPKAKQKHPRLPLPPGASGPALDPSWHVGTAAQYRTGRGSGTGLKRRARGTRRARLSARPQPARQPATERGKAPQTAKPACSKSNGGACAYSQQVALQLAAPWILAAVPFAASLPRLAVDRRDHCDDPSRAMRRVSALA